MKKLVSGFLFLVLLASCSNNPKGYLIEGTITGEVSDSTLVFLRKTDENNKPVEVDTTMLIGGKFTFEGPTPNVPDLHYVFLDKTPGFKSIILEKGAIEITAQKDSLVFGKAVGTPQNDTFEGYIEDSKILREKALSIFKDLQNADNDTKMSLNLEYSELQEEYRNFELNFIKDNPDAVISVLLIERALAAKVVDVEAGRKMLDSLAAPVKETVTAQKLITQFEALEAQQEREKSTSIGAKAPNFSAPTPSGEELALNDVLGKVTIVDFWAAWCKPCRVENPNVVRIYNKYHKRGLNIIGVSLDRTTADWEKAIKDDGLPWNHVANIPNSQEIAALYNVVQIPTMFVLDENGIIVAKNLRGDALEAKIAELLPAAL